MAAPLKLGFASDVTSVSWRDGGASGVEFTRRDREKLSAELSFPGKQRTLLTVRPRNFPPAEVEADGASAPVRAVESLSGCPHRAPRLRRGRHQDVDITKADS